MKAVILAGGKGTRLAPYTYVLPKPMMPVGDRAILEILLQQISRAGIKKVTLAVGHLASLMQAFFKDGSQYGVKIDYVFEPKPLGTAGPLANVEGLDKIEVEIGIEGEAWCLQLNEFGRDFVTKRRADQ